MPVHPPLTSDTLSSPHLQALFLRQTPTPNIIELFLHDVTTAILIFQNNETVSMLVLQINLMGVELFCYVNNFVCSNKKT